MGGSRFLISHPFRSRNQAASYVDKQKGSLDMETAVLKYLCTVVFGFLSG